MSNIEAKGYESKYVITNLLNFFDVDADIQDHITL